MYYHNAGSSTRPAWGLFHKTSRRPYWCTKQRNGGHFGESNQSCGNWTLYLCKDFFVPRNLHSHGSLKWKWYQFYYTWCAKFSIFTLILLGLLISQFIYSAFYLLSFLLEALNVCLQSTPVVTDAMKWSSFDTDNLLIAILRTKLSRIVSWDYWGEGFLPPVSRATLQ